MALKDIEKLKEKFIRDQNSKLFLPLAEEYRKEGMLDEAIEELQKGIKRHATYTSARVLLGKIYLEKGMLDEAKNEFESVVQIVPDNLFAYKKLADIYRNTGEAELAMKAYKSILKLNPLDEETINNLRDVESVACPEGAVSAEGQPGEALSPVELRMPENETVSGAPDDIWIADEAGSGAPDVPADNAEEELRDFKDSLLGRVTLDEGESVAALDGSNQPGEAMDFAISEDETLVSTDEILFPDMGDLIDNAQIPTLEEPGVSAPETAGTIEPIEVPLEREEGHELVDISLDEPAATISRGEDIEEADRFVADGRFFEAMAAYRKVLASDPDDRRVLQRVEELKALLKLMGKDKEALIATLDAFLEGIYKRRDEFFRRS